MTYRVFLFVVLITWPLAIIGLLLLMTKLERYVNRLDAATPEEAGLEPVAGTSDEKEVRIVFDDPVIAEPDS
ncbi:MAG: hypothetical protein H0V97_07750 [Actinobacteria bacterium]|nr:hypothetical protein [Actinomycetota bacterium]